MDAEKKQKTGTDSFEKNSSNKNPGEHICGEIRTDYRTGLKSMLIMGRNNRPKDVNRNDEVKDSGKQKCPFEPEKYDLNKTYFEIGSPWRVRTIYNKYPLLDYNSEIKNSNNGFFIKSSNFGYSFVIIDTPEHTRKFEDASEIELKDIAEAIKKTEKGIFEDEKIKFVYLNKNYGSKSSGSLFHSHLQVLGFMELPMMVSKRAEASAEYMKKTGRCLIEDAIEFERVRRIKKSKNTVSYAPFAPIYTGESVIVPKRHVKALGDLDINELVELLWQCQRIIKANNHIFGSISYNIMGYSFRDGNDFHSYLEIIPRPDEIGPMQMAGYYGSTIIPEDYSRMVRNLLRK
ncbi:MAG: hypothetical protein QW814_00240 [Methanothrix sp.]